MAIVETLGGWLRPRLGRIGRPGASRPTCALLIDGDSVAPRSADSIFAYAQSLGTITSAQLFGNFAGPSKSWATAIRLHGFNAMQFFSSTARVGKNGADMGLCVAAMDLLHRAPPDIYAIVSTDSDFSPLVHRLRRSGAMVHGIGPMHAARTFQLSCNTFVFLNELEEVQQIRSGAPGTAATAAPVDADAIEDLVLGALLRLGGARDWVPLDRLGEELARVWVASAQHPYPGRTLSNYLARYDSVLLDRAATPARARLALVPRNGSRLPGEQKS